MEMHSYTESDENTPQDLPREVCAFVQPSWMNLGNSRALTHEDLREEWERIENRLPERLGLRVHRALSWVERAEREQDDDPDAAFIFYWIAFNATYAQYRPRSLDSTERDHFADFL